MLTDHARRGIITAGRDDAFVMASPLQGWMPPTSQRWMAAYFFFFLFFVSRPKRIAFKTKGRKPLVSEFSQSENR